MKQLNQYIVEKLKLNNSINVKDWKDTISCDVLLDCLKEIKNFSTEQNIEKLIKKEAGEYFDKLNIGNNHWKVCKYIIDVIYHGIKVYIHNNSDNDKINLNDLTEYIVSDEFIKDVIREANSQEETRNSFPESLYWDEDEIVSLFNTICNYLFHNTILLNN